MMTASEKFVSQVNSNVFFKYFTYNTNKFKDPHSNQELQLADHLVWLENIFFIYETKERNHSKESDLKKWFHNKILKKAVSQIKRTHHYLNSYPSIEIPNQHNHWLDVKKGNLNNLKSIILYDPSTEIEDEFRFKKFKKSSEIGLIHLFHVEDYMEVCKYLATPCEVEEYLDFRERLFTSFSKALDKLPEQYVLSHFIETDDVSEINLEYIRNMKHFSDNIYDFDIQHLISHFDESIDYEPDDKNYYSILIELAKLNRIELHEFKKRMIRSIEVSKKPGVHTPFRFYTSRTDCAFVFIPIAKENIRNYEKALLNYTEAQKYCSKSFRAIGLVIADNELDEKLSMNWAFIEHIWKFDKTMEELLKTNFPFRPVNNKVIENRYKVDGNS